MRDNIEAVRTAFTLDRERRTPTERERALLERYCGFGGLKCILNPARELADAARWAKSDLELFAPTVELHRIIRENSKDETEYKRYVDSLKASVLTAFYTPKAITDTIADVLHDKKVRPNLVLEPSAGMGAFIGSVLSDNPQAEVMAFEKDLLTGKMLGHLYPQQKIRTEGFEKIEKPFLNRFDLAISNIPFGDIAVFDPEYANGSVFKKIAARKVHTYFFLKGLDAVRDGGIQPFEEKVVVYGFRRHAACGSLARGEGRIEDGHVAERDIGDRCVEIAVERFLDALEPLRPYFLVGIETGEDFARQEVFLEGHDIDGDVLPRERPDERSVSCGGFQQAERAHIIVVQHVGQSLRYRRRGIERRQHGAFQAVDITLVFVLAGAVLTDQTVQLHRLREQVEVGFRPLDGIGQRGGGIEDTFQSPETAVAGEPLPFFGSGRPSCLAQLESRPYRLDIIAQLGFTVKGHSLPARLGQPP